MRFKASVLAGMLLAALSAAGHATVLVYKSFDRLVAESEGILVGTVRSVQVAPVGRASNLHTYVTLDNVEALSGQVPEGRITLRIKGGSDGRQSLRVVGAPSFRHEERVLLFVQGNGADLVPFVGWSQGVFRLKKDKAGHTVVHDADDNEVVGIRQGHVMRQQAHKPDTALVGAPAVVNRRNEKPHASAGRTDDGSPVKELGVETAAEPAMTAEAFVGEVRKRAGAGKPMRSVRVGELTVADETDAFGGRDHAAPAARAASSAVALPAGNSVALPMGRDSRPAADQR